MNGQSPSPPGPGSDPTRVLEEAGALEWLAVCGFIVVLNVFAIPENFAARPDVARWKILVLLLASSLLWLAATPALFWIFDRFPVVRGRVLRNGVARATGMLLAAGALGSALVLSIRLLTPALGLPPGTFRGPSFTWGAPLADAAGSVTVLLLMYAFLRRLIERRETDRRAAKLENALLKTQLHALSLELQPHFLFNTLNGIAELIGEAPDRAEAMLIHLSDLLRSTLQGEGGGGVPLREELRRLDLYIRIQRMRLSDRVTFRVSVDPDALAARVPAMLLQPLVENAITHGVGPMPAGGVVEVRVERSGDAVTIRVVDNGAGFRPDATEGIGLSNSRARLEALFGGGEHLEIVRGDSAGTEVRIRIPYEPHSQSATQDIEPMVDHAGLRR